METSIFSPDFPFYAEKVSRKYEKFKTLYVVLLDYAGPHITILGY